MPQSIYGETYALADRPLAARADRCHRYLSILFGALVLLFFATGSATTKADDEELLVEDDLLVDVELLV